MIVPPFTAGLTSRVSRLLIALAHRGSSCSLPTSLPLLQRDLPESCGGFLEGLEDVEQTGTAIVDVVESRLVVGVRERTEHGAVEARERAGRDFGEAQLGFVPADEAAGARVALDEEHVAKAKPATGEHGLLEEHDAELALAGGRFDEDGDSCGDSGAVSVGAVDGTRVAAVQDVRNDDVRRERRRIRRQRRAHQVVPDLRPVGRRDRPDVAGLAVERRRHRHRGLSRGRLELPSRPHAAQTKILPRAEEEEEATTRGVCRNDEAREVSVVDDEMGTLDASGGRHLELSLASFQKETREKMLRTPVAAEVAGLDVESGARRRLRDGADFGVEDGEVGGRQREGRKSRLEDVGRSVAVDAHAHVASARHEPPANRPRLQIGRGTDHDRLLRRRGGGRRKRGILLLLLVGVFFGGDDDDGTNGWSLSRRRRRRRPGREAVEDGGSHGR
mmetsp:Transcript_30696/g.93829  ORF Transcript_30696/g.93829 Transcript_30696/m.93829 type:complete len:446 (-) Transcript_30696:896-2233(-)